MQVCDAIQASIGIIASLFGATGVMCTLIAIALRKELVLIIAILTTFVALFLVGILAIINDKIGDQVDIDKIEPSDIVIDLQAILTDNEN